MTIAYAYVSTPIGELLLTAEAGSLIGVAFERDGRPEPADPEWRRDDDALRPFAAAIRSYFAGTRTAFDLPLDLRGTPFQRAVWQALQEIPYGTTISYGELATRVGNPKASRAVGAANGRNPIPILVPCHRVIGSNGKLTGFGGGLPVKEVLLNLERGAREQGLFESSQRAGPGERG